MWSRDGGTEFVFGLDGFFCTAHGIEHMHMNTHPCARGKLDQSHAVGCKAQKREERKREEDYNLV